MRLLDTTTKQLRTFYGKKIPKYAILSHMWGREEDEVLFRHIAGSDADKGEGEQRKGYAKITGACKQAIEDGWKYIWIDTCCIDKTSSAELSEAINSMYEWYWNSGVCYVYLEDVGSHGGFNSSGDGGHDHDEELDVDQDEGDDSDEELEMFPIVPFERSRWFKRGWTLQELIAPRSVVFYSKDWIDIGTKASLRDTISAVTRIRVEMLTSYDSERASVAEKMSWAAFRKTTRAEDVAYCLMGLLGVNMPLLYGEGNKAFRRLQEEFMKVSDDDSLFAWKCRFDKFHLNYTREGMLATSPWDFRNGMDIVQSDDGAYSLYSMTNQGLQIKLPLLPVDPNLEPYLLILTPEASSRQFLNIREGHYQRIFPHWLDETETPLSETELTSLLVPQISTFTTSYRSFDPSLEVKILPTESGFTVDGHGLVEGYKCSSNRYGSDEVVVFKRQDKCFGVAIGWDRDIPWLDFIDTIDEKQSPHNLYWEQGSRAHLRKRHLDRLSERIPREDWWVTVSVKMNGRDSKYSFLAVIDIQREPIQAKRWLIPPEIHESSGKNHQLVASCQR